MNNIKKMYINIFGTGAYGKSLINRCRGYVDIKISHIFDSNRCGFIDDHKIEKIEEIDIEEKDIKSIPMVIAMADVTEAYRLALELHNYGIKQIYLYLNKRKVYSNSFFESECCYINSFGKLVLPNVEMHVIDCCNLNCRGCTHFSPIFERKVPDTKKRLNDISKLREIFDEIIVFSLLGGEPFLNPSLKEYIYEVRKNFKNTEIHIITNGILIPRADNDTLQAIKDTNATVFISEYYPTHLMKGDIIKRLESNGIEYGIRDFKNKETFNMPLSLSKNSIHKQMCISKHCTAVCDGQIARCPTLLFLPQFNKKYGTNLSEQGILLLDDYSKDNGGLLIELLERNVELCRHCVDNRIKWEPCGNNPSIDDFATRD